MPAARLRGVHLAQDHPDPDDPHSPRPPRCRGGGGWWSDGNHTENGSWSSWGDWSYARCEDRFDYASAEAHDDAGTLARVAVSAEQKNASSSSSSFTQRWDGTSGWSHQSDQGARSDAWSRNVTVATRAGDARASHGCASASSATGDWTSWDDGYGWSGASRYDHAWNDRCGVSADAAGESAFAGQRCADGYAGDDWYGSQGGAYWMQSESRSGYACSMGADATPASAGLGSGCAAYGWRYEEGTHGENGTSLSRSYDRSDCRVGATLVGPDGAALFVGHESQASTYCDEVDGCEDASASGLAARLAWTHNPLGPGEMGTYVPLP